MTIKTMRAKANMTQKEFSEYLNIPKRSIENWESGQRNAPEYLIELINYKLRNEEIYLLKYYYAETNAYNCVIVVDKNNNAIVLDDNSFDNPLTFNVAVNADYSNFDGCETVEECANCIGVKFEIYNFEEIKNEYEKIIEF